MSISISGEQRDALYARIIDRLSGLGDIEIAVRNKDYQDAESLAREYSDELRLVVEDLGWGDGPTAEPVELKTPAPELARIFSRLRESTDSERHDRAEEWAQNRLLDERNQLISETCQTVLDAFPTG